MRWDPLNKTCCVILQCLAWYISLQREGVVRRRACSGAKNAPQLSLLLFFSLHHRCPSAATSVQVLSIFSRADCRLPA